MAVTMVTITLDAGPFGSSTTPDGIQYTVAPDRMVRVPGVGVFPFPAQPLVSMDGVPPTITVPANDDPGLAIESQGYGIKIIGETSPGGVPAAWMVTVTTASAPNVNLSDLSIATPIPPGFVDSAQLVSQVTAAETSAANSATSAAAAAALVGAPAGSAIDAHLGGDSSHVIASMPRSLAQYGVLPENTAAQNAAGFLAAQASGYTNFVLPAGTYQYAAAAEGDWMMTFTGASNIKITGLDAVINDTTVFSNNGPFTGLFLFDGCTDCEVTGIQYVGPTLGSPSTLLGYQGAILVRAINQTNGVRVDMRAANCRYGVQTGEYGDPTKGQCRNFDVNIRGTMIGYSMAMYFADGITHDLDVDGVHRIAYFAGCNDVKGTARFRNQYIADIAYLLTDVLVSGTDAQAQVAPPANPTSSRGCTNVRASVQDMGSSVFQSASFIAGISLSRVDPVIFRNIDITIQGYAATNTISTTFGGWEINSTAKSIWNRYTYNWSSSIVFQDVSVHLNIDHSGQTVNGNTTGDIYVYTVDGASTPATITNMTISGTVKKASGDPRMDYFNNPGIVSGAALSLSHNATMLVVSNPTAPVQLSGSYNAVYIVGVTGGNPIVLKNATVNQWVATGNLVTNVSTDSASTVGGAGSIRRISENKVTLSGTSTSWTGAIPAGALLVGVQAYVVVAVAGTTGGWQIGVPGAVNRYGNALGTTAGSTSGIASYAATETSPRFYQTATDLVLTPNSGSFTGGQVHIIVTYDLFPNLTK